MVSSPPRMICAVTRSLISFCSLQTYCTLCFVLCHPPHTVYASCPSRPQVTQHRERAQRERGATRRGGEAARIGVTITESSTHPKECLATRPTAIRSPSSRCGGGRGAPRQVAPSLGRGLVRGLANRRRASVRILLRTASVRHACIVYALDFPEIPSRYVLRR